MILSSSREVSCTRHAELVSAAGASRRASGLDREQTLKVLNLFQDQGNAHKRLSVNYLVLVGLLLMGLMGRAAWATTKVDLPDQSQTTTIVVTVGEQCKISVPGTVTFTVNDISAATAASAASIAIDHIVLATATKQLRLSIKANAAAFTPSGGGTSWAASDVSWGVATWTTGTGASGNLNNDAATYSTVATSTTNPLTCSTSNLVFTLAPKATFTLSGTHSLVTTWKVESIGT